MLYYFKIILILKSLINFYLFILQKYIDLIKLYYDMELYYELNFVKIKYNDIYFNKNEFKFLLNIKD